MKETRLDMRPVFIEVAAAIKWELKSFCCSTEFFLRLGFLNTVTFTKLLVGEVVLMVVVILVVVGVVSGCGIVVMVFAHEFENTEGDVDHTIMRKRINGRVTSKIEPIKLFLTIQLLLSTLPNVRIVQ